MMIADWKTDQYWDKKNKIKNISKNTRIVFILQTSCAYNTWLHQVIYIYNWRQLSIIVIKRQPQFTHIQGWTMRPSTN